MPKDEAYSAQQQGSTPSCSSGPSTSILAPSSKNTYANELTYSSTDQPPAPSSIIPPYPIQSSKIAQYSGSGQIYRSSGVYTRSQTGYPLYHNTSTLGPTATYSTAISSNYPWYNSTVQQLPTGFISSTSDACNCPPPSTVTVQNTVTLLPTTVTTILTLTATAQPAITPTATITITTTVCVGNEGSTGTGGGDISAIPSKSGGYGPSTENPMKSGGIKSGPFSFDMSTSGSVPQITGSGEVTAPYQPPFANVTGSSGPSFPVGTGGYLPTSNSGSSLPSVLQPPTTFASSEEQTQPPFTTGLGSEAAATSTGAVSIPSFSLTSGESVVSSGQGGYGESSASFEQPQTSTQNPGPLTTTPTGLPTGGQSSMDTHVVESMSATPMSSVGSLMMPPYGSGNNMSAGLGPATSSDLHGSNPVLTFPAQTGTANSMYSALPPFVNTTAPMTSTLPLGTGMPYQPPAAVPPQTSTAALSTGIISPAPYQSPPYPIMNDNGTKVSMPTGSAPFTTQMPLNSAPVYQTITKEVIPIPLVTNTNNSMTQKSYGNAYGNGSPTGTLNISSGSPGETTMTHSNTSLPILPFSSKLIPSSPPTTGYPIPATASSPVLDTSPPSPYASPPPPPPLPPPMNTTAPSISSTPNASPPPPNPPQNQTTPPPACTPTPTSTLVTASFHSLPTLPTPYLSLLYTGFSPSQNNNSITAPSTQNLKSLSIAPPALSFNLSSISLTCEEGVVPCHVHAYGQTVQTKTEEGAAAAGLVNGLFEVDASGDGGGFTRVEGLEEKGWVNLAKVSFAVQEEGVGLGIGEVVYTVGEMGGCG